MEQDQVKNSTNKNNVYFLLGILFLFGVWFVASLIVNNSGILPNIDEVFTELVEILKDGNTYALLGNTFIKIVVAILVSFIISLLLAVLSLLSEKVE